MVDAPTAPPEGGGRAGEGSEAVAVGEGQKPGYAWQFPQEIHGPGPRRMHDTDPRTRVPAGWPARLLAIATVAYTALLVWATHHPKPQELLGPNPPSDKFLHLAAYGILAGLVALTLLAAGRLAPRRAAVAALALAVFAALDEVTQPLPWFRRSADPLDWVVDVAGILIGIGVVAAATVVWRRATRRHE